MGFQRQYRGKKLLKDPRHLLFFCGTSGTDQYTQLNSMHILNKLFLPSV